VTEIKVVVKDSTEVLFQLPEVSLKNQRNLIVAPIVEVSFSEAKTVCGLEVNATAVLLVKEPTPLSNENMYFDRANLSLHVIENTHVDPAVVVL